jgi:D-sedoheptulose 7-phosphate isomerase
MSIAATFAEHAAVLEAARGVLEPALERAAAVLTQCLAQGGTILACGNGGSAADAEHLVAELVGRFRAERRPLAAVALSANIATVTALANDYGFEQVFARQVTALGRRGDVLVAISTSGRSPNVLAAARAARARELTVIALTGAGGGELKALAQHCLEAPSQVVARIQEIHGLCIHALCEALDAAIAAEART